MVVRQFRGVMRVLVTGVNGQLGREVVNQLNSECEFIEVITCTRREMDIVDYNSCKSKLLHYKPNFIINCAAYTNVKMCEENYDEAYDVNVIGPRNLAEISDEIDATLIHISTDYVFDGESSIPYIEDNFTKPVNSYGKTKLLGENYVRMLCSKYFVIRTSWLFGDGNNFVNTMLDLSTSENIIKVVNDQIGSPTSTYVLSKAIISLLKSTQYGLYHISCDGMCSWYEFASKIFEILCKDIKIIPIDSKYYSQKVHRPKYSVLDSSKFAKECEYSLVTWEESLKKYLCEKQ